MKKNFLKISNKKWFKQNFIVIFLSFFLIILLSIGYSVLSERLDIKSNVIVKSNLGINIISIENEPNECGYDIYNPKYNDNIITINGNIEDLKCELVYKVTVLNNGDKSMELIEINDDVYNNKDIVYKLDGIDIGDVLLPDSMSTFKIIFSYDPSLNQLPDNTYIGAIIEFVWQEYIPLLPVLIVDPEHVYIEFEDDYNLMSGVSAVDGKDGDITSLVTYKTNFNPNLIGKYTITYYVTNSRGYEVSVTRTIEIIDTKSPIIAINDKDSYTIFSGTDMNLNSLINVSDNYDKDIEDRIIINSSPISFSNSNGGLYDVVYSATDSSGNISNKVTIKIYVIEFIKVAAGRFHTLALTVDGFVYSWGHNDLGQLGDGTLANKNNAIKIPEVSNIIDIAAGYGSSYLVNNNNEVYSWGYGIYGQLGHGNTSNINKPTKIESLDGIKIKNIDAGYHTVIALSEEGKVYTWGYNIYRQIGDNTITIRTSPYEVTTLSNIKHISVGYWHTIAASDKEVWVWGSNAQGQLGIPGAGTTGIPTKLSFNGNIKQIVAGGRHNFILTNNGEVYVWGYNYYGQAGIGNTTTVASPTLISTLSNIKQISGGYEHSVAIDENDEVYVWGNNAYAKLGIGNTTNQSIPVKNTNLNNIRFVSAQFETIIYIQNPGGIIYGAGNNIYGALGNGNYSNTNSTAWGYIPSKVIFNNY